MLDSCSDERGALLLMNRVADVLGQRPANKAKEHAKEGEGREGGGNTLGSLDKNKEIGWILDGHKAK